MATAKEHGDDQKSWSRRRNLELAASHGIIKVTPIDAACSRRGAVSLPIIPKSMSAIGWPAAEIWPRRDRPTPDRHPTAPPCGHRDRRLLP